MHQELINRHVYHSKGIDSIYDSRVLDQAETMALLKYQSRFVQKDILDAGIGTGRTTAYLQPLASSYVGVDYSPAMIDFCGRALPDTPVRLADVRDLSIFSGESFDFVFAPCNMLDAVDHAGRLQALAEFQRVLRSGGALVFSSHNRRYREALLGPRIRYARNPVTQANHLRHFLRQMLNHRRIKRFRRNEQDYALLDDPGHDFRLLHYYIDRDTQAAQLRDCGFRLLDVFDLEGRRLQAGDVGSGSSSLLYVAESIARESKSNSPS